MRCGFLSTARSLSLSLPLSVLLLCLQLQFSVSLTLAHIHPSASGLHFYKDSACIHPIALPNTTSPFFAVGNINAGPLVDFPYPSGPYPETGLLYDCINLMCVNEQFEWVAAAPDAYNPLTGASVRGAIGWAQSANFGGQGCAGGISTITTDESDLRCFSFGGSDNGIFAAIDCFGLIERFPPSPMATSADSGKQGTAVADH